MPVCKSEKGPRNVRLTILVPQSVMDDLRALREATSQSTGDLLNGLIEQELIRQADTVKDGYEFMRLKESLEAKSKSRVKRQSTIGEASHDLSSEDVSQPAVTIPEDPAEASDVNLPDQPTEEDVIAWSEEVIDKKSATQRKSSVIPYLEWLQSTGKNIGEFSANQYVDVLKERYGSKKTVYNHIGKIRGFVRWWNTRKDGA